MSKNKKHKFLGRIVSWISKFSRNGISGYLISIPRFKTLAIDHYKQLLESEENKNSHIAIDHYKSQLQKKFTKHLVQQKLDSHVLSRNSWTLQQGNSINIPKLKTKTKSLILNYWTRSLKLNKHPKTETINTTYIWVILKTKNLILKYWTEIQELFNKKVIQQTSINKKHINLSEEQLQNTKHKFT